MECTQVLQSESFNEINTVTEKCPVATLAIGGEYHTIYNKENVIGRENTCDVIISNSAISSKHAVIEAEEPDAHLIYDLGSTNKTKLGKMVLKPHVRYHINDGDSVTFGNVSAQYNISRQYPTTPVKANKSRNSCSTPEIPERPDPTQKLTAIEDKKFEIKVDSTTFNTSDIDLFDEDETNPAGNQKENSASKIDNDIYELDTLSFDENVENNIQPTSTLKQDSTLSCAISTKNNNVENTLMSDLSVYDVSTQEPVSNQNHLSGGLSIFDKDKEKNNYDGWEDFPEIASPDGLDTSNADNLDCPKAKLIHTANKNQDLLDERDLEVNDEVKTITNSKESGLIKTPKKPEQSLENDFYMPFSQNVDMFEMTPVKSATRSLEQNDIYEMLTQVSNNNEVTNDVDESIYDIQTELAVVINESTPNGSNYKKNDIASSRNDSLLNILEPATQPFETNEVASTSFTSVKIVDETDQDCTFSTTICEAATQPYQKICEENPILSIKEVTNEKLTEVVDTTSVRTSDENSSFSTSLCEVATQPCPQIIIEKPELRIDKITNFQTNDKLINNMDCRSLKQQNESDGDISFSTSMYEAATQPCPQSYPKDINNDGVVTDSDDENDSFSVSKNELATQPCPVQTLEKSPLGQESMKDRTDSMLIMARVELGKNCSFSDSMFEAATQPCPQSAAEKSQFKEDEKQNITAETHSFSTSMYEVATQPCPQKVFEEKTEIKDDGLLDDQIRKENATINETMNETNVKFNSTYEIATQPCNVSDNTSKQDESNRNCTNIKQLNESEEVVISKVYEMKKYDNEMTESFFEAATQPAPGCQSSVHNETKDEESSNILLGTIKKHDPHLTTILDDQTEFDNQSGQIVSNISKEIASVFDNRNDSIQNLVSSLSNSFFKAAAQPLPCKTDSCFKVSDENCPEHLNSNNDEKNVPSKMRKMAQTTAINVDPADVCKSNTGALQKSTDLSFATALPNALSDSFFEAATQPYKNVETEEKTFLDPLTSLCNDLSVDKISEITDELMYGNISTNLADTNNIHLNNNEELHDKIQQNVEISDDNIYEALNQTPSSSLHNKVLEKRINDENETGKLSTQDLKRILESDDEYDEKYGEFQQNSVLSKNSNRISKKEIMLLDNDEIQSIKNEESYKKEKVLDKEQTNTLDHVVLASSKNSVIHSESENKALSCSRSSDVLPMVKKNIKKVTSENENDDPEVKPVSKQSKKLKQSYLYDKNMNNDDDSSQELNIRSNKKRCNVFPPDSQNFGSENLENEDTSQELNIRSNKKRCNVFPPDSQNFDSENLENEDTSQELNIRSNKKRCNVFPPDSGNDSCKNIESRSEISQEPVIKTNISENSSSSDVIATNAVNKLLETDHQSDKQEKQMNSSTCNKPNSSPTKLESKAVKAKSVEKNATSGKRSNKESKNKYPQEREPIYISRGNITLHSPEVLSELEKQFRLTQVAMSPSELPIASDVDDDADSSEEKNKPSSKKDVKRSRQNKKNASFKAFKGNSKCNQVPLSQNKLESISSPRTEKLTGKIGNKISPTDSTSYVSKTEKSFKKFKKVSPMKNNSFKNEKEEKITPNETGDRSLLVSYNSDNSQNSEELGRGKRKRIRTSYEGFILEEDKKRNPRKKISFSQIEDDGNLNDSAKIEARISKDPCESNDHQRNCDSVSNFKHTVSVVLHDFQKKHPEDTELIESDTHKSSVSINKKLECPSPNEEEAIFLTTNKKCILPNTSIRNEVLSKTKKTEILTKDNKNFSLSEKLDELFNIWGPADRVKLSPRVAKKSYKLLADGKIEGGSTWSATSNGKKSEASNVSNNETKNSKDISNKPSIDKKHTPVSNLGASSSNSNVINSMRKSGLLQKNELFEPQSEASKVNKMRKKNNSENSMELDKTDEGDSAIRKSSRILSRKNLEGTGKDSTSQSKPEQVSTRSSGRATKGRATRKRTVSDQSEESTGDCVKNMPTQSSSKVTEKLTKAQPLNSIINVKNNNQKPNSQTNKNSLCKEQTSSSLIPEDVCCFSQEFSFHETKIQERRLPEENCLPPPLKVRRSNRRKNEKVVEKNPEHIMFTGFADKKTMSLVNFLGGQIVESPFTCTVLVTDKIRRTTKFLSALSRGLPIVSPQWLIDSKENGRFMDIDDFMLSDKEAEKMYSFNLKNSIEKAQNSKLLDGWSIFVTSSVKPSPEEMKSIIECSGGRFLSKEPSRWPTNSLVISCNEDRAMWSKFSKRGKSPTIVENEAIFLGVLRQELNLEPHMLL